MNKIIFALGCFILIGLTGTAYTKEVLSGEQVREALSGNTLEYLRKTKRVHVLVKPDGKLKAQMHGKKQNGKWHINEKGFWCRQWKNWLKGHEGCFEVVHIKKDDYEFRWKTGTGGNNVSVKLLSGDAKDLTNGAVPAGTSSTKLSKVGGKDPYQAVTRRDTDADGRVSHTEWEKSAALFEKIDSDGDGFLTPQEFYDRWKTLQ